MHEWLVAITNCTVLVIDAMVSVIIAVGTIQALTPSRTTDPDQPTTQIDVCFNDTSSPT
jgi:hypothetical protein